jgi:cell shape-determining protein MreD
VKSEPYQQLEKPGLPRLPKCIALMVLAVISGFLAWSFHNYEWPGIAACLVLGCFFGVIAGGLVGVRLLPSLMTMAVMCGLIEGVYQGWQRYGSLGAALGGLIGAFVAVVVVMLPVMVTHLVMVLRGIDPLVDANGKEE